MKFVLAPDKFKGSLSGMEFCRAAEKGIQSVFSDADIIWLPLADGGDGTIEVINYYLNGKTIIVEVSNPFFQPIKASYIYSKSSKTAFIEMAEASGVKLLRADEFDCKNATTFGTGEMILDAINNGASKIILGIGGSATNDCGIGMAAALGYQFLDKNNQQVKPIGANLSNIVSINISNVTSKLSGVIFEIACDVTNPLYGKNGAAYVYAAQKGADPEDILMLDTGLQDFSKVLDSTFKIKSQEIKGAGAAGGMGIGAVTFLSTNLTSGIELIKELADFDQQIIDADWIITGEGKLDAQTSNGKTLQGVVASSKAKNISVAVLCGAIELDKKSMSKFGIQYSDAVMHHAKSLEDAIKNGSHYLEKMTKEFAEKL